MSSAVNRYYVSENFRTEILKNSNSVKNTLKNVSFRISYIRNLKKNYYHRNVERDFFKINCDYLYVIFF
jgi:hypothetical protein